MNKENRRVPFDRSRSERNSTMGRRSILLLRRAHNPGKRAGTASARRRSCDRFRTTVRRPRQHCFEQILERTRSKRECCGPGPAWLQKQWRSIGGTPRSVRLKVRIVRRKFVVALGRSDLLANDHWLYQACEITDPTGHHTLRQFGTWLPIERLIDRRGCRRATECLHFRTLPDIVLRPNCRPAVGESR